MAVSSAARRLTHAHRLAQTRLGARTVAAMVGAFGLLDLEALDASFPGWLRVVTPLVQAERTASARLGANYLSTFRALELGVGAPAVAPVLAETASPAAVATSMLVTGPVSLRANLARAMPVSQAVDIAQSRTASAAMRHVLNGGRQTILETTAVDRQSVGWQRVTSGSACSFCEELAAVGIVFHGDNADTVFQAHDNCTCTVEPVFDDQL